MYGTEYKIRSGLGLVWGRLAVLKISDWALKYVNAPFEGNIFCFRGQNKFEYKFGIG